VLIDRFGVSERHACRVVGQHRATQRNAPPIPNDDEMALRAWLRAFALVRPRWGWRRAAVIARQEGWRVNNKRIQRLWRSEGLKVPYRKRKKPLRGKGVVMGAMCPIRPNVLWALDFQFDQTSNGRTLKLLNVIDEFTRECPAIEVARNIDADGVVACLERIAAQRGAPMYVRFDNGPSSLPTPWRTGAASTVPQRSSSIRDHRGRTPGSSRSTAGCVTSSSTVTASIPCSKPRCSSRTGESTTT
jgi:putative transposase